ncbi:virulence-associated E family protein [Streptococcus pyogenes]|uniref:virulence-associated E family protein n=1 Tax=Streptococcus pyogenes TaxID=1314 RepID=UPI000DF8ED33|nr:virulence-associated E family protein [Streptococcus pyogenes]SUO66223.1 phage protein [Streptococcus pyogenes]
MIAIGELRSIYEKQLVFTKKKINGEEVEILKSDSPKNVLLSMKIDSKLSENLRNNSFSQDYEIINPITLDTVELDSGQLPNDFEAYLTIYFENHLGIVYKRQALEQGMRTFFAEKSYNPVKEYMEKAYDNWDHKERLHKVFQHWLGVSDNDGLTSKIAEMFFVGCVTKVFQKKVKFDYVLDLVGGQGVGKTSFLQKIGMQWYTDAVTDFQNKDNYDVMLKSLIVNDDEMVATKKTSFAELKSFISKTEMEYRRPYDRRAERYDKNFVIARTTNELEYLRDKTGERRFLPMLANPDLQKKHPLEMSQETVDQLWGEAVNLYKKGYKLSFDEQIEKALVEYREQFSYKDEIELQILEYLDMLVPDEWETMSLTQRSQFTKCFFNNQKYRDENQEVFKGVKFQTFVSTREILKNVFDVDVARGNLSRKVKVLMDNLDGWMYETKRVNGKSTRGYSRKSE